MLELWKFVFSSFWVFCGSVILISIIAYAVSEMFSGIIVIYKGDKK